MTGLSLIVHGAALCALAIAGYAFMPRHFVPLDEACGAAVAAEADPRIVRYAPAELERARDTLQLALTARATGQEPEAIEQLADLARQRLAIARESARLRSASNAAVSRGAAPFSRRLVCTSDPV